MRISCVMVLVPDMTRSVAFYRDVLGLELAFESSEWTEFVTDGATLALHKTDGARGEVVAENSPASCRPGFAVPALAEFHQRMLEAGVPCV